MVNIQLSYDSGQALDPESWNGNFHTILLHRSIEHLVSDVKNIKDSLIRMHKYILVKQLRVTRPIVSKISIALARLPGDLSCLSMKCIETV